MAVTAWKTLGAAFVVLACTLLGRSGYMDCVHRAALLDELIAALRELESEMCALERPLPDTFALLAGHCPGAVGQYFRAVADAMDGQTLRQAWQSSLPILTLPPEAERVFSRLGDALGRYDSELERREISAAVDRLERIRLALCRHRDGQGKSFTKLAAALGALLAVILF